MSVIARFKKGPIHGKEMRVPVEPGGAPPMFLRIPAESPMPSSAEATVPDVGFRGYSEYQRGEFDGQEAVYHWKG